MNTGASGRLQWIERVAQPRLVVAIVALLLLGTLGALRLAGDDDEARLSTGRTTTTTTPPSTSTTEPGDDGVLADDSSTTTTTVGATSTSSTTSSTTSTTIAGTSTTVCRNSGNPSCGAFRWDPAPAPNEPIVVSVSATPQSGQAQAGKPVAFTVHAADVDAAVAFCEVYDLGDGTKQGTMGQPCEPTACGERYGPWTPPERRGGTFEYTLTHTYTQPGTYTVRFFSYSGDGSTCHPYASSKTTELTFVVASASA